MLGSVRKILSGGVMLLMPLSTYAGVQAHATMTSWTALKEGESLLATEQRESGRLAYSPDRAVTFPESYHVFVKSALAINFTYRQAWVDLPLFRGLSPSGDSVYYVLTESSNFQMAKRFGVNYAPKMAVAIGSGGVQNVTIENGIMRFKGAVNFRPVRDIEPGPSIFPPKVMNPGSVADAEWSSFVVTPAGIVYNVQILANSTGAHDRVLALDKKKLIVRFKMLDGFENGRQYFYHMVTDASAQLPAALEDGTLAPRLAKLPSFGNSSPKASSLLGFSPVLNGISDLDGKDYQGFVASLANGLIDPINVFPLPPENDNSSLSNNYSPMWDAHISQWTQKAIDQGRVRRIRSFEDLGQLVKEGWVESAYINPPGQGNPFVFGLRPTQALINCPIIAHPELPEQ